MRAGRLSSAIANQPRSWDTSIASTYGASLKRVGGLVGKGLKGAAKGLLKASSSSSSSSSSEGGDSSSSSSSSSSSDESPYVDVVVRDCEKAWAVLCGTSNDGEGAVGAPAPAGGGGSDGGGDGWDAEEIMVRQTQTGKLTNQLTN